MITTTLHTGCPVPVQYPLVPDAGNEPLVINTEYTDPYMTGSVAELETPILTIVVDDPNPDDDIEVKVIMGLNATWEPGSDQHDVLLQDSYITPSDVLPPEDASNMGVSETTRRADIELNRTPCADGQSGAQKFLWVCVTDRSWESPPAGHPNENPCLPRDGYMDGYPIIVTCTDPE